ncbi:uncharacterized protein LOC143909192 [Arctopsyche grandis]|uniref:uncharacterized protein LOC143909192 n=1 Tax=Arctopsyche grandis TaxID=121162 RepID=UPI00406D88B2
MDQIQVGDDKEDKDSPRFAITRYPGFGFPLTEGMEVSLRCEVECFPPAEPKWLKDDRAPPVIQTKGGFLNFTSLKREHSGWYKCTANYTTGVFSSIGYFLNVRHNPMEATEEPNDREKPVSGRVEVALGGVVQLQCPAGSIGCWGRKTDEGVWNGAGSTAPHGALSISGLLYQEAGEYRCEGMSAATQGQLQVLKEATIVVTETHLARIRNVIVPVPTTRICVNSFNTLPSTAKLSVHEVLIDNARGNEFQDTVKLNLCEFNLAFKAPYLLSYLIIFKVYINCTNNFELQRFCYFVQNSYSYEPSAETVTSGPTVFPTNRTVLVSEGQSATFSAEFCANPAPTRVVWISSERLIRLGEHSGQIVAHNATNASSPGCSIAQLTIEPAGLQHNGEFSLLVRNPQGSKEAVFQLAVTATRKVSKTESIFNDWLGISAAMKSRTDFMQIYYCVLIVTIIKIFTSQCE